MKLIPKKSISKLKGPIQKPSPVKIVPNIKSIPKGNFCSVSKKETAKEYRSKSGESYTLFKQHVCPYLEAAYADFEGEVFQFCALLNLEIDFGLKVCGHKLNEEKGKSYENDDAGLLEEEYGGDDCYSFDEDDDYLDEEE